MGWLISGLGPLQVSRRPWLARVIAWLPVEVPRRVPIAGKCHGSRSCFVADGLLWPESLLDLDRPPLSLQWCGRRDLWSLLSSRQAVAVIGTRRPSTHGLRMAEALGRALAFAGWPVVSGLAEGIDAAVHRACVQSQGVPVGVLGTPLHRVYPPDHRGLQQSVAETGLLFTELRDDARVQRSTFALRNRLLVAVARAVVIVECPKASGALHSAAIAESMARPLWVIPGDALRHSAQGSNAPAREGFRSG